jgi:cytochrome c-type biogenesis protein CcmH
MSRWCWPVLALWLMAGPASGLAGAQAPAPTPAPLPAALEQEARQIERMLIAPCCWMQPVSEHQSQASDDVKQQIRMWLSAGMTRQQVLDAFVEQYSARILAEPPNAGFGRWLYLGPLAIFGASAAGLVAWVKRMTATKAAQGHGADGATGDTKPGVASTGSGLASSYEEQLDDELREMD